MPEQPRAKLDIDAVGGVREQISAKPAHDRFEQRDAGKADDEHVERRLGPVHEHFVDHHLEEQGRDEREQLQEERGDEHLPQQMAIFPDRAQKPGEVEAPREAQQAGARGHEEEAAVPFRFERGARHEARPRRARRQHERLLGIGLRDQEKPAGFQRRDPRQRRMGEPIPLRAQDARLQPQFLRKPQHIVKAHRVAAEAVHDLARVCGDAMKAQQRHERGDAVRGRLAACVIPWLNVPLGLRGGMIGGRVRTAREPGSRQAHEGQHRGASQKHDRQGVVRHREERPANRREPRQAQRHKQSIKPIARAQVETIKSLVRQSGDNLRLEEEFIQNSSGGSGEEAPPENAQGSKIPPHVAPPLAVVGVGHERGRREDGLLSDGAAMLAAWKRKACGHMLGKQRKRCVAALVRGWDTVATVIAARLEPERCVCAKRVAGQAGHGTRIGLGGNSRGAAAGRTGGRGRIDDIRAAAPIIGERPGRTGVVASKRELHAVRAADHRERSSGRRVSGCCAADIGETGEIERIAEREARYAARVSRRGVELERGVRARGEGHSLARCAENLRLLRP